MTLEIVTVPLLSDNYAYLLHAPETGSTAVVDPSEAEPVLAALKKQGWSLDFILNTHHHNDHIGGNAGLKAATGAKLVAARADAHRIPGIDVPLDDGDGFDLGGHPAQAIAVPGHTHGHIAYWFERDAALFAGDTLFSLGCGRLFEGTPAEMWQSLRRLRALPADTRLYCGHEYTESNARYALTVEPDNADLRARKVEIDALRSAGRATLPVTLGQERATNPFLRVDLPNLKAALGLEAGADDVETFAALRRGKDNFR